MSELKPPPHSPGHEKSVLSCMLQYSEHSMPIVLEQIDETDFFIPAHRKLFGLLASNYRDQKPIDLVAISQQLMDLSLLEALGGASGLAEIYSYATTSAALQIHLDAIKDKSLRRMAINAAGKAIQKAKDESDEEWIRSLGSPITDIFDRSAPDTAQTKQSLIESALNDLVLMAQGNTTPVGISTGFDTIDDHLKGFHPKRFWILSATPASGKTVLGLLFCWYPAVQGVPTLFITLEMSSEDLVKRLLAPASGVHSKLISDPLSYARDNGLEKPSKEMWQKVQAGKNAINNHPIHFEDHTNMDLTKLTMIIRRHVRENQVKVVCVDYAQLIKRDSKVSRDEAFADISHSLRDLAKELSITIVLLSQENVDGATKYSSAFGDDADAIISIAVQNDHTQDNYKEHLGILIKKDRHHGNSGALMPLYLNKSYLTFTPYKESHE